MSDEPQRRLRAYRFTLDAAPSQITSLAQHAGAARWAFNFAHALLTEQHQAWEARRQDHITKASGLTPEQIQELPDQEHRKLRTAATKAVSAENKDLLADLKVIDDHRKRVTHKGQPQLDPGEDPGPDASVRARRLFQRRVELAALQESDPKAYRDARKAELADIRPQVLDLKKDLIAQGAYRPGAMDLAALWRTIRDLPKDEGGSPWWEGLSVYAFASGFDNADTAWKNWMSSAAGQRAGRRVGMPRFKKKGRARDSFTLYGSIRLATYRRLNLPGLGEIRLHDSGKRLHRTLARGGTIKSVTVSRGAHRWYASVLVDEPFTPPAPTQRQRTNPRVGVNLGVHTLAALSNGELVDNPRHLDKAQRKLTQAQRKLSRTSKGSGRRARAAARVARLHHQVSEARKGNVHQLTKRLATQFGEVALQDLDVVAMTASARGTVDNPGRHVKQKARLNRAVLDASFGEIRRQLTYKTGWYGSTIAIADRFEPVDQTCSACGATRTKLPLSQREFRCVCGLSLDRGINAARNIAKTAIVASDSGETQNARGGSTSPPATVAGTYEPGRPSG